MGPNLMQIKLVREICRKYARRKGVHSILHKSPRPVTSLIMDYMNNMHQRCQNILDIVIIFIGQYNYLLLLFFNANNYLLGLAANKVQGYWLLDWFFESTFYSIVFE